MSHIFISYSKQNREYAQLLKTKLLNEGFNVWIDDKIEPSEDWWKNIRQAIKDCVAFAVVMTPEAEKSRWVNLELLHALEYHKPLFPLLLKGNTNLIDSDVWSKIADIQYTDVRDGDTPQDDFFTKLTVIAPRLKRGTDLTLLESSLTIIENLTPPSTFDEPILGMHITDEKGIEMVYCPTGNFLMGSNEDDSERPIHEVQIVKSFWLDLLPVTNAAYARFIKDGGYKTSDYWTQAGWDWLENQQISAPQDFENFTDPLQPRVGVSWYEAFAYSVWRGGRLPTEAEWEWAARGPESYVYPWGDVFNANRLVYKDNSLGKTAVVGSAIRTIGASWIGALDMCGNVWEWVNSLYESYPCRADSWRENVEAGTNSRRVLRGGSWHSNQDFTRAAYRLRTRPFNRDYHYGFRCVRPINIRMVYSSS